MKRSMSLVLAIALCCSASLVTQAADKAQPQVKPQVKPNFKIVLIAGSVQAVDKPGHHDYIAGCKLLETLLKQTTGVETALVLDGWPKDEKVFDGASSVVFYTDGGGKQAYLKTPKRVALIEKLVASGVGIVNIHQAVDYPGKFTKQATSWIGGTYVKGKSGRGHWPSAHTFFYPHPIARGVKPWKVNDGWLNKIQFVQNMKGITPLLRSSKVPKNSDDIGDEDVVAWTYERPGGGRSFCYTGLDMHQFFKLAGVRQMVVNGVLWSAGASIPEQGAPCQIGDKQIDALMTPRKSKKKPAGKKI